MKNRLLLKFSMTAIMATVGLEAFDFANGKIDSGNIDARIASAIQAKIDSGDIGSATVGKHVKSVTPDNPNKALTVIYSDSTSVSIPLGAITDKFAKSITLSPDEKTISIAMTDDEILTMNISSIIDKLNEKKVKDITLDIPNKKLMLLYTDSTNGELDITDLLSDTNAIVTSGTYSQANKNITLAITGADDVVIDVAHLEAKKVKDTILDDGKIKVLYTDGTDALINFPSQNDIDSVTYNEVTKKIVLTMLNGTTKDIIITGFSTDDSTKVKTVTKVADKLRVEYTDGSVDNSISIPNPQIIDVIEWDGATQKITLKMDDGSLVSHNLTIVKSNIGLDKVDNTSDADKPISTLTQTALDLKVDKDGTKVLTENDLTDALLTKINNKKVADVTLDTGDNTIDISYTDGSPLSTLAIPSSVSLDSVGYDKTTQKLSFTLTDGTVKVVTLAGLDKVDNTSDADKPISTLTQTALDLKVNVDGTKVLTTNDLTDALKTLLEKKKVENVVLNGTKIDVLYTDTTTAEITLSQNINLDTVVFDAVTRKVAFSMTDGTMKEILLGLENVDNTSDSDKPISTAQQTALDNKVNIDGTKVLTTNDLTDALKDAIELKKVANVTYTNDKLKIDFTDSTNTEILLSSISLDSVAFDEATNKLSMTMTDGAVKDITLVFDKADVGLSDVNNTSDLDKPISILTQDEINKTFRSIFSRMSMTTSGKVTFASGKLGISERIVWIPTGVASYVALAPFDDVSVEIWQVVYMVLTDAEIESGGKTQKTKDDLVMTPYSEYVPSKNHILLGYRSGEGSKKFIFANGQDSNSFGSDTVLFGEKFTMGERDRVASIKNRNPIGSTMIGIGFNGEVPIGSPSDSYPDGWAISGGENENFIAYGTSPYGKNELIWTGRSDSGRDADGGMVQTVFTQIDPTKTYRATSWVKKTGADTDGINYFSVRVNGSSIIDNNSGDADVNPHFNQFTTMPTDKWYLQVGYIYPSSTATTSTINGGLYEMGSLTKVRDASRDFRWGEETSGVKLRHYNYYCENKGTTLEWFNPRLEVVDGTETPLATILGVNVIGTSPQYFTQSFTREVILKNGNAVIVKDFDPIVVTDGKAIKVDIMIPIRSTNDESKWGGAFFNVNAKVNGTWYNLGTKGYNGVMIVGGRLIGSEYISFLLDFPTWENIEGDYEVVIEVMGRTYGADVRINSQHDVNTKLKNMDYRGELYTKGSNQNYMTLTVVEVD